MNAAAKLDMITISSELTRAINATRLATALGKANSNYNRIIKTEPVRAISITEPRTVENL